MIVDTTECYILILVWVILMLHVDPRPQVCKKAKLSSPVISSSFQSIPSSWMVHAGCVFVASSHLSRTWMSGSFESLRWNANAYKLDLGLCSHPNELLWNGVRTHVNWKGKIPSTGGPKVDWTRDAASRRTARSTLYRQSYTGPLVRRLTKGCWLSHRNSCSA